MNRVIDYPARDMTITVEAGVTLKQLADSLAAEHQWLPIDVSRAELATVGGVVACDTKGPRRYGYGTMRDYVIGISAIDGQGMPFKGGGRVVKNVAGYDFCKLLTGSLGTLGVITQVTLKIRPRPKASAFMTCEVSDFDLLEKLLAAQITSNTTPIAIEFVCGPAWNTAGRLLVGFEGSEEEVTWLCHELKAEWNTLGVENTKTVADQAAPVLWEELTEFAQDDAAPLVLKASLLPSEVCSYLTLVRKLDARASLQVHAGSGIVIVKFAQFAPGDVSELLIGKLQPAARRSEGYATVLSSSGIGELTRQAQWGSVEPATAWMTKVKQQFDPQDVLNPGRFVYS
jgi:glycolate oxidase FAD binding subunit